ncbi:hypothetical protein ACRCD8_09870 [Aliarcobacter sp. ERUVET-8]|uniref:hypothetical protein n=1 Tax=Aliarcobacter sp. ERUVET-8 TaxID=3429684 RepID=UPI003D6A0E07
MIKKRRGNADYFKVSNQVKREKTIALIRDAVSLMNETNDILDIKTVSQKTKEIDIEGKGVSEATFRKKDLVHIQSLMLELGIGKYQKIKLSKSSIDLTLSENIIDLQKEQKKMQKKILDYQNMLKSTKSKLTQVLIENEELRVKIYEIEMNIKFHNKLKARNNIQDIKIL